MSQILAASVSSTPTVPTQFTTDVGGPAVPVANNLDIVGGTTSTDNTNGIQTSGSGDTVTIQLTNRFYATDSSANGATVDLITFDLGVTTAVYRFKFEVAGRDTGNGEGVGYTIFASARTDGVAATIIATPFFDNDEDTLPVVLTTADIDVIASGNNVILRATGVAGRTILYAVVGSYVVV